MKKLLLIVLVIALCAVPLGSGCASDDGADDGVLRLAYIPHDLLNPYFIEVSNGMRQRAEELGVELDVHDARGDVANQISAVENYIAMGFDGLIITPLDEEALIPSIAAAREAGLATVGAPQDVPGTDARLITDEYGYGFMIGERAGEWIRDELGGEAQVAILDFPELAPLIARGDGLQEGVLSVAPNAQIVARQSAAATDRALTVMESILLANPEIEVVVTVNDAGALGAFEAVRAAGLESDRWFIGGLDATEEALRLIREGSIFRATVDQDPFACGGHFLDLLIRVLEEGPIEGPTYIPMWIVDSRNIHEYPE